MQASYTLTLLRHLNEKTPTTMFDLNAKIGFSHETIHYALKELKQIGLVRTKGGRGGGTWLTKPYHEIYVHEIIPLITPHEFIWLSFARYNQNILLVDILKPNKNS